MRQSTATPDDLHRMTRMLKDWERERGRERDSFSAQLDLHCEGRYVSVSDGSKARYALINY